MALMDLNAVEMIDGEYVDKTEEVVPARANEIATEINLIKRETWETCREICARSAIKIGGLLNEAKAAVGHGNWENWLRDNVDYSISTAQRLMKLADTYGGQLSTGNEDEVTEVIASLLPSKALLLAQLAPDQRREYVESHDVESESVREMREQIKILQAEKEQLEADISAETNKAQLAAERLELARVDHAKALEKATKQAEDAVKRAGEVDQLKRDLDAAKQKLKEAKEKQKSAEEAAAKAKAEAKSDPDREAELERLRQELKEIEERTGAMEEEYRRKLERAANPNMQVFLFAVKAWQKSCTEMLQYYAAVKGDDAAGAERFAVAIRQQLTALEQSL